MVLRTFRRLGLVWAVAWLSAGSRADEPQVPAGFTARLVASVPAVEYPCQVATAPGDILFVAEDPMDQRGPYEAFDGRILVFRPGHEPAEFATGFRAVQGMAWYEGRLYVCHMPYLTVLADRDGDWKAEEKVELFKDLGQTANQGLNDHIVSGIQFGIDGWLYISVGDKGVPGATRPEDGQKVQLRGGGVLRCRPDGRGLEVFASGTRNHLEANLDELDHVFVYDNTDDGDGWWTRVAYLIDGGYYGYPYDYHDRPDRFLNRMEEYGGGSPCGALFYREDAWPSAFRGVGLWAEWGKGKVHGFRFKPSGASFEVAESIDFALPARLKDFRPIDLALSDDGKTLYIADWNMGGWGNQQEKVGRVWAVSPAEPVATQPRGSDSDPVDRLIAALDHAAYNERVRAQRALIRRGADVVAAVTAALESPASSPLARRHLIWVLDGVGGGTPLGTVPLLAALQKSDPDTQAEAARALGDRQVPIAVEPLLGILESASAPAPLRLQAVIALGRIGDARAVPRLLAELTCADRYIAFSARVAIRRIADWGAVVSHRQEVTTEKGLQELVSTLDQTYHATVVELLSELASAPGSASLTHQTRSQAVRALALLARKAPPWDGKWWGTRPSQAGPPRHTIDWEATAGIDRTLAKLLESPDASVRKSAIEAVRLNPSQPQRDALRALLSRSHDPAEARQSIVALADVKDSEAAGLLLGMARSSSTDPSIRLEAIKGLDTLKVDEAEPLFVQLLERPDLGTEAEVALANALGRRRTDAAFEPLRKRLGCDSPELRAAACAALGRIGKSEGLLEPLLERAHDPDKGVRTAAIAALGQLRIRESVPGLVALASDEETRYDATRALADVGDIRALRVYLRGITDKNPELRRDCARAIGDLRDEAAPILNQLSERKELPGSAVTELRKIFAVARPVRSWQVLGPLTRDNRTRVDPGAPVALDTKAEGLGGKPVAWTELRSKSPDGSIDLGQRMGGDSRKAFAYAEVESDRKRPGELRLGSDDSLKVWLNGKEVYSSDGDRSFELKDHVEVELVEGMNRLLVECGNSSGDWKFGVSVAQSGDYAFLNAPAAGAFDPEAFARFAQEHSGNAEKGKALFEDLKGLACIKCHKVQGQGGDVGPDLSGIATRYQRPQLIESILYPSAQIFSGYEPVVIATEDGQILTGILKRDEPDSVAIQDSDARLHVIPRADIEERGISDVSLMPTGLAEGLTPDDFANLIQYLETLRDAASPATPAAAPR